MQETKIPRLWLMYSDKILDFSVTNCGMMSWFVLFGVLLNLICKDLAHIGCLSDVDAFSFHSFVTYLCFGAYDIINIPYFFSLFFFSQWNFPRILSFLALVFVMLISQSSPFSICRLAEALGAKVYRGSGKGNTKIKLTRYNHFGRSTCVGLYTK